MGNIPVNRWVIAGVLAATAIFGGDFVSSIFRVIAALGGQYLPAS